MSARGHRWRAHRASAGALAALCGALVARAAPADELRASAHYDVPPSCVERSAWLDAVRARLPPLLRTHPLLETLSVRVEELDGARGAGYQGELGSEVEPALNGAHGVRGVRGASCSEVLDALSFMGALGLVSVASGHDARDSRASGPASGAALPAPPDAVGVDEAGAPPASSSRASQTLRVGAVGMTLVNGGLLPAQAIALGMALRIAWSTPTWQPSLLLGAYASLPDERRVAGGGKLQFEHWSSHAVACPWRFPRDGLLGLRPCVEVDVGRSSGEGLGVIGGAQRTAPWISAGTQLRAEVVLGGRVELGASIAGVVPLWRSHFDLLPDSKGFDTPSFGFRAGSDASLLF